MTVDRKQFPLDFGGAYPLPAPPQSDSFVILLQSELNSAGFTANLLGAIRALSNPNVFNTDDYDAALSAASAYAAIEVVMADLCATIADCISNSPATRQAILDLYNELPAPPSNPQPLAQVDPQSNANLLSSSDCSNDNIYAYCLQIVQLFNSIVTDTFELIEAATNSLEVFAALLDDVPILGTVADVAQEFQENIAEGYAAGYTVSLEADIACDLFCIAQQNCELSLADIRDYYGSKLNVFNITTFEDAMQYIGLTVYNGAAAVYAAHLALSQVLMFGGSWSGQSLAGILRLMVAASNDNNPDWSLCDCSSPVMVWSFSGHAITNQTITGLDPNTSYELRCGNGMNQNVRWGDPSPKPNGYGDALYWYIDSNGNYEPLSNQNAGLYVNGVAPVALFDSTDNGLYTFIVTSNGAGEITFELRDPAPSNNSGSMAFELWTIP